MAEPKTEAHLHCYHCGEDVEGEPLRRDDKEFCCLGCATVYELLRDNDLCDYYQLNGQAGLSQRDRAPSEQFKFLDDDKVAAQLLDFADGQVAKVTFFVPAIHCSSCIWLLENLHKLQPGVAGTRVNFLRKEVSISFDPGQASLRQVADLLAQIGYPPHITLESLDKAAPSRKPQTDRALLYKAGVAFFCFGNMMLLSFPEYLTLGEFVETNFRQFFGYLNILLALPVVFYCSTDYFQSAYQAYRQRQMNIDVPIALGIVALFGVSLYEILTHTGAGYLDSLGGLLFFLLSGRLFQQKTYDALSFERDYKSYFPISVTVRRDGAEHMVQVADLKRGDRMVIHHQELVPADARLLKTPGAEAAMIDYSFVTGEAVPVAKPVGELVYAGGRQTGGTIELEVVKEFSQSYLTQLWNNEAFQKGQESQMERITNKFSKAFTTNVLVVSTGAALYWLPQDVSTALRAFTSVLIIACPCAISLAAPFALGTALRIFGRRNFYLKNTAVIERLAATDTVVLDKTGTLTDTQQAEVAYHGAPLTPGELAAVGTLAKQSTHPLSKAVAAWAKPPAGAATLAGVREVAGQGLAADWQGQEVRFGSARWVLGDQPLPTGDEAGSRVYLRIGPDYRGYFQVQNRYRDGVGEVIAALAPSHKLMVLSGDNEKERARLEALFADHQAMTPMAFGQSPQDKLDFVAQLRAKGRQVMMLGDGLNDAGALKQSNVGVAVSDNVLAFSPASDAILDGQSFAQLPQFVRLAKASVVIIRLCFVLSLGYNVVGLSFAVRGALSPVVSAILMPLSSVTVVAFATLAVRWVAGRVLR
jgi:Cu+-exporting ATPase